jgi:biopolymer transport protein TolR
VPRLEPLTTGGGRGGRRGRASRVSSSLAEINVVPLVDVMLVLLVIFMVAAPMMQQGIAVRLPESRRSVAVTAPVTVTVPLSFRKDRRVQIGSDFVPIDVLAERVRQALDAQPEKRVIVAGDGGVTLSEMFQVWDQLKQGGVANVDMQTQPPTGQ